MMKMVCLSLLLLLGLSVVASKRKHLLMTLMSVEFIALILFVEIIFVSMNSVFESYVSLYYLVMSACEGCLGLSLIVIMVRNFGGDFIFGGSNLQC